MVKEVQTVELEDEETSGPGGRPPHEPTAKWRAEVESLSGSGVPHKSIAKLIAGGMSHNTLRKHYMRELELGEAKFQALLGQTASRMALGAPAEYYSPGHPDAGKLKRAEQLPDKSVIIFMCKTRLGLRESIDVRKDVPDDAHEFNTVGLSQSERVGRLGAILDAARTRRARRAPES